MAPNGLREKKKQRVRQTLARVALRLYRDRGFDATTVDDLARAANVSRRTVFRYFPSKEAIVFPHHDQRLSAFRASLKREERESSLEALRRAMLQVADVYQENRDEVIEQYHVVQASPALVAHELELDREWQAAIEHALRASPRVPDSRSEFLAGMTMGVIRAALGRWFRNKGRLDLVALGNEALDLLEHGANSKKQRKGPE